eukprot:CCRYP_001140-RA/>CCRYP_001140-RA protein AED:0.02 eAED:0.02 QI:114/0.83/0.85/1/0.5/0.42/7/4229/931
MKSIRGPDVGNRYQPSSRGNYPSSRGGGAVGYGNNRYNNAGRERSREESRHSRAKWNDGRAREPSRDNGILAEAAAAAPDTDPPMRVLTFYEIGSRIALAAYLEDTNEILFEDSTAHNGDDTEGILRAVLLETRPNLILVGSKVVSNAPLLECLTRMPLVGDEPHSERREQRVVDENGAAANDDSSHKDSATTTAIPYQLLKSSAFEPRACRTVILEKLRVLTLMRRSATGMDFPRDTSEYGFTQPSSTNYHALASIVNFDSPTLIRALGSLLIYLRTTAFRLEEGSTVTVNDIRRCTRSNAYLRLEDSTLRTLRIFATDFHPLQANNSVRGRSYSKSKEGFSIYTLLDRTKSKSGKERLRQWMMKPLRDVQKIRQRHVAMELFLHPSSHSSASLLLERLAEVGNIDAILLRMQRCCAQPNDFLVLGRMLEAACDIVATLGGEVRESAYALDRESSRGENGGQTTLSVAFVEELLGRCYPTALRSLRERIASVIDEEVTAEIKDHVVIHYGFHEELDRAKETFETLNETLSEVGRQVLAKHEELISLKVVFLPQVGFLVSIDKRQHAHDEATNSFPNVPEDFDFVFLQDNDAFFKNSDMNQLDEEIGDLDAFIKDIEALIVSDLEEEILECESELRSTFSALADLDCILSLAGCAADLNLVKPEIAPAEEGVIDIENGRHPLQELIVNDEFIPNDTAMDNDSRLLIVTGPNFSGKSCYARQVGVLVYLAHLGSYLPCDRARISVMDQILVNFGDVETCSVPQSTFQRDLTQMAGTAPASGIAVMTSTLQKLSECRCKVVCTTHFLEMFSLGLLVPGQGGIKAVRMSIHVPESDEDDAIPLFKLEDGVASSSAGLICARMAGLNKKVVDRASEIIRALREGKQVRPLPESMNANSPFQPNVKSAIRLFLAVDSWATASDEDLDLLQELVGRI